jgi:hypothetical protein
MINLIIAIVLMCSSFGAVISKKTKEFGVKKQREHTEPLRLD